MTKYRNDIEGYWSAYKSTQETVFQNLMNSSVFRLTPPIYDAPHFECVYCHEKFPNLEKMQEHYASKALGADPTIIGRSRRGYTPESWERGQEVINAPTIRSVQ